MPRIRCRYIDCVYSDDGICGAATVLIDPDEGCLTYTQLGDVTSDDWDDEDLDEIWDVDDDDDFIDADEDEDEVWMGEDDI